MAKQKIVIIGAGIAGIATAIRLAVKGHEVQLLEANSYAGGKLSEFKQGRYRFDAGPSLFTMPQYVDELFTLANKNPRDYFNYKRLDTTCKYFYEDGLRLTTHADLNRTAQEIEQKTGMPASAIHGFMNNSKQIYSITNHVFLERSLQQIKTYTRWDTLRSIAKFQKIDSTRTMHHANATFFNDSRIVQLFDRYATYNGSNPYQAPATLNVIPHLEHHFGAYFPEGGMYSIVTSLVKLAEELGVKIVYNSLVQQIVVANNKAKGVMVDGKLIEADIVISNTDVWFTYIKLLANYPYLYPKRILKQERSSSALIFYWGVNKSFPQLDLHNIFFSKDYKAEFDHIWQQGDIYHNPTIYLNITSKYKPDDAPHGRENWFVMINVPANNGQDWDALISSARKNILKKFTRLLGEDISNYIESERVHDPRTIEQQTFSYQGALYGTSSNNKFSAFMRHANRSSKVKNLYFCGGSVHPGGGIPLCLLSAKIVSDWIDS